MASSPSCWEDPQRIDPANPPRAVKPRKPHREHLPILAVGRDGIFSEPAGELLERDQLARVIAEHEPAVIPCLDPEALLAELHRTHRDHPLWQFRLVPVDRQVGVGELAQIRREQLVANFGWRRRNGRATNRYFYPVSPMQFGRHRLAELSGTGSPEWARLLAWAEAVRRFCLAHELRFGATAGSLAAQLLRSERFYPEPRRKVPMATNEAARGAMPGNYYELAQREDVPVGSAWEIDQHAAHHFAAETTALPHPDGLYARGHYAAKQPTVWLRPSAPSHQDAWRRVREQHGLIRLTLETPRSAAERPWVPPAMRKPGPQDVYVFTSELPELLELGASVRHVTAAWTAKRTDEGLRRYAGWCRREAEERPADAAWLKGTLLAAYGILGARPRRLESRYWWSESERAEPGEVWLGPERVPVQVLRTQKRVQTPIANVIQRGMIEATTRGLSLALARELTGRGHQVLAVYADAIFVRDVGIPLPLLARPWRVKGRLSHLIFHSPQAYTSIERKRLPGVPRSGRLRRVDTQETERGSHGSKRQ